MKNIFYPFLLLLLLLSACRKDIDETITDLDKYVPPVIQIDVQASLGGHVVDENDTPVADAVISMGGRTTTTNFLGLFEFPSMILNSAGSFVMVEKEGFYNGSHRFFPQENSSNFVKIKLLELTPVGTFASQTGGIINTIDGVSIEFPEDAIVNEFGNSFDGLVTVNAVWLDPMREDLLEVMPGNLQGVNSENSEVALESYGMIGVELRGNASTKLQLATGKKAKISLPVPDEIIADAPKEIPLWSFDETIGIWKEESVARLINGFYVGDVSHFSFWNCDAPFPLVQVFGRLIHGEGGVLANAKVKIKRSNNSGSAYGYTNSDGYFSGKVPANEALILEEVQIADDCSIILDYPFGPLLQNTDLGDIYVPVNTGEVAFIKVQGTLVACDGSPLEKGWVSASFGNGETHHFFVEGTGGNFNFSVLRCGPAQALTIIGFDIDSGKSGFPLTFDNELNIDLGAYSTCGNSIEGYISVKFGEEEFFVLASELTNRAVSMTSYYGFDDAGFGTGGFGGISLDFVINKLATLGVGTFSRDDEVDVRCPVSFESETYGGFIERTYCDRSACENYDQLVLTQAGGTIGELITGYYTATTGILVDYAIYVDSIPMRVDFSIRINYEE